MVRSFYPAVSVSSSPRARSRLLPISSCCDLERVVARARPKGSRSSDRGERYKRRERSEKERKRTLRAERWARGRRNEKQEAEETGRRRKKNLSYDREGKGEPDRIAGRGQ